MADRLSDALTPAEWKVMKVIWRLKKCAGRDVYEETRRQFDWAPSTTKTILARLVDKGYLTTTRVGNSFLYRPARWRVKTLLGAADALAEHLLEGTTGPVLAHLVTRSKLSADELVELKALIDTRAAETRGERQDNDPATEKEG